MLQGTAYIQAALAQVMPTVRATGLLSSSCTFYQPDGQQDVAGAPSGTYTAISNLSNLACMAAPYDVNNIAANEKKSSDEVLADRPLHVLLDNYYGATVVTLPDGSTVNGPQTWFKADIGGIFYDVLGVESDSQIQMTRFYCCKSTLGQTQP